MGTLSLSKAGRLFWLGRYTERVYTSLKNTRPIYDCYVDGTEYDYAQYCTALGIPNVYTSTEDFCLRYLGDQSSPCSLVSLLYAAYDNAIVLRDTIGTDTFSYIQLACNAMEKALVSTHPEMELQWVLDDIMAFRGSAEYSLMDESSRTILRTGANLERLDLYLRLDYPPDVCRVECERLINRVYKIPLTPDQTNLGLLIDSVLDETKPELPPFELLRCVEGLFPEV